MPVATMKTTLFILCLFVSAMVAHKTKADDLEEREFEEEEEVEEEEEPLFEENATQENTASGTTPALTATLSKYFRYKPSQRLEEISNKIPKDKKELIKSGLVRETMTDTLKNSMDTAVATEGLANLKHEWELMVAGPEASRVIGTLGQNLNHMLTSSGGSEFISTAYTTAHVLLSKAGEETRSSGLGKILSMAFFLFTSPEMPEIVNKTGELIVTAVNKPDAPLFVRHSWDEVEQSLSDKNLNKKLGKCYGNIFSLMNSYQGRGKDTDRQQAASKQKARNIFK